MAEVVRRELIIGGQRSGKSRRAETLAGQWLAMSTDHQALLVATALPGDAEMRDRIARHQYDRAERVPGLQVMEEPERLADALLRRSAPQTLLVVDCLTLWLTNLLMPAGDASQGEVTAQRAMQALLEALPEAPGPVVLVSNEIGLGVIPLGREVRGFVDALGRLNQAVAAVCDRVTFMAAGLPLVMKGVA